MYARTMKTWSDLIDEFGGPAGFAPVIGVNREAAKKMYQRNSVHTRHWRRLITNAPRYGVGGLTIESLFSLEAGVKSDQREGRFQPEAVTI